MAIIATLVVGANGATTLGGSSRELSSAPDRARFLALHRSADAIITGKRSANSEDYSMTKVPIFIFSRDSQQLSFNHPTMQQVKINGNLAEVSRQIERNTSGQIVVEAGPELLTAMIAESAVDLLQLSISPINGDGDFIDVENLLSKFTIEREEELAGTRLLQCRYNGYATNS
jgi:riboflavin biosynthesis pyrimidine reductase